MADHAARVVAGGGPLGKTRKVWLSGISDIRNAMTRFIVVQAETHEAAAKLF